MAYTGRTWVPGEGGTAAKLNTIRDDTDYLKSLPNNRCVAYRTSSQSVSSGNTDALTLDAEDVDTASMHSTSSNTSRITIPVGGGGWYRVIGQSQLDSSNNPTASLHLKKNGSTTLQTVTYSPGSVTNMGAKPAIVIWEGALSAGDYLELYGQAVGSACTFGSSTRALAISLIVVGPQPPN